MWVTCGAWTEILAKVQREEWKLQSTTGDLVNELEAEKRGGLAEEAGDGRLAVRLKSPRSLVCGLSPTADVISS